MKIIKSVSILGLSLCVLSTFLVNQNIDKVDASDIASKELKTIIFTTNGLFNAKDLEVSIKFANSSLNYDEANSYKMDYLMHAGENTYLYKITIDKDIANKNYAQISFSDGTSISGNINSSSFLKQVSTGISVVSSPNVKFYEPSYQTRRIWFKLADSLIDEDGYIPAIYDSNLGVRYLFHEIYNNNDESYYFYADVPASFSSFGIREYLLSSMNMRNANTSTTAQNLNNESLHQIRFVSGDNALSTSYELTSVDQYFVNAYLEGFTSCLENDVNGFLAFPYIKNNVINKYSAFNGGSLDDVYQNDYLKDDFINNNYKSTSIKDELGKISAQEKLNQLSSYYTSKQGRVNNLIINENNNNVITIIFLSFLAIFTIGGYLLINKRIKKQ